MPLNESVGSLYSNLTEQQQREAEQALYGLDKGPTMSPEPTHEEYERMRQILAQHDAKTAQNSMKEFDLNKPPSKPYIYQEFPFLMYHHQTKKTRPARNNGEREQMLVEGWSMDPFPAEGVEIPLTAAEHAEADEIDARLTKKRR